jgi:arylsulfatase A-like enzyme
LVHWPILQKTRQFTELDWRSFAWNAYRFVERADTEIGIVLAALDASPFRDNTVILFSVDHGEAAGQHQMFQKFTLYEESIRTPLIVATLGGDVPIEKGVCLDQLVSGVDIPATICDYVGVDPPPKNRGRSLRSLAEGESVDWRQSVLVESNYWGRAVVTERWKYITEYQPKPDEDYIPPGPDTASVGREQLFDLDADPGETRSVASEPQFAETLAQMRRLLREHENGLERIALEPGGPRHIVDRWGERLRALWEAEDGSG